MLIGEADEDHLGDTAGLIAVEVFKNVVKCMACADMALCGYNVLSHLNMADLIALDYRHGNMFCELELILHMLERYEKALSVRIEELASIYMVIEKVLEKLESKVYM